MTTIEDQGLLAFPAGEYHSRLERCRAAMAARDLDAVLVTAPENICYLTGFTTPGYHVFQAVVVSAEGEPFMVLRNIEVDNMRLHSWLRDAVVIEELDYPERTVATTLQERLGAGRRIGYDDISASLPPRVLARLREDLPGGELIPAGGLVEALRVIKSDAEVCYMRRAAAIAERALLDGVAKLATAATDSDVAGTVQSSLMSNGSEFTGSPAYVVGTAASADAHAMHNLRPLTDGSSLWLEVSASLQRYHACVSRTAFRKEPPEIAQCAFDASRGALEAMIAAAKEGVTSGEVDAAGREIVKAAGFGDAWRNRAAYSIGLSFPPGLGEGHIIDIKPSDPRILRTGMAFHLIPILKIPGVGAVGCTESVVVGPDGAESLATLPRRLLHPEDAIQA
jgi:Xaa-Pro dipeptidase